MDMLDFICNGSVDLFGTGRVRKIQNENIQSFAQFRTFAQFRIIQIEEYLILLNDSAGEFKLLSEKVHSLTDIFI